jgi:hypothetical protein
VDPHSWASAGGTGAISEYNGLLIVSNTSSAQTEVVHLLDELAQHSPVKEKVEAKGVLNADK